MKAARAMAGLLVWHVDRSRCTVQPNLAARLGLTIEAGQHECSAASIVDRIHPEDREKAVSAGYVSFASGGPYTMTFRIRDRDNKIAHVHQVGWWTRDDDGRPQSLMIFASVLDQAGDLEGGSRVANGAFIQASSLIALIRRIAIDEGWRNIQHLSDVMSVALEMTMLNTQAVDDT